MGQNTKTFSTMNFSSLLSLFALLIALSATALAEENEMKYLREVEEEVEERDLSMAWKHKKQLGDGSVQLPTQTSGPALLDDDCYDVSQGHSLGKGYSDCGDLWIDDE